MHIRRDPSFLRTKNTEAFYGETLGWIKPLSRRSVNCSFNFFNLAGAILYGKMVIGRVFENNSIPKFISLSGVSLEDH